MLLQLPLFELMPELTLGEVDRQVGLLQNLEKVKETSQVLLPEGAVDDQIIHVGGEEVYEALERTRGILESKGKDLKLIHAIWRDESQDRLGTW